MTAVGSVRVRLATSGDTAAIIALVNTAFRLERFFEGTRTDAERMKTMRDQGQFLVIEDDVLEDETGRIVASIWVELRGERGYLGMLAVHPERQGSGLARAMMQAAEDHSRQHGCKFTDLTVLSLRPELLPLYRKLGYVEIGTDEFHPSRPLKPGVECHCVKMAKAL